MTDPSSDLGVVRSVARHAVPVPILIAVLLGLLVGAAATYYATNERGTPVLARGTVMAVSEDSAGNVTSIAFRFDDHDYSMPDASEGLAVLAETGWTDAAGQNHGGDRPACLARDSYGPRIELGVLDVRGNGPWPTHVVVWVHCLS